jgi:hypothetical protein
MDATVTFIILLAVILVTFLARRFVKAADQQTLEVSDYTVLVQGLPEDATADEVGRMTNSGLMEGR